MKISTKGRYAIRAMIALSRNGSAGNIKSISEEEGLSAKYLEAIFSKLSRCKLVAGKRGPSGGYKLAKPSAEISAFEILDAMGDELVIVDCVRNSKIGCKRRPNCPTRPLWTNIDNLVTGYLKSVSLADLSGGNINGDK